MRVVNRCDEVREFVVGQRSLDQWEEHTFLVANVRLEAFTELVQLFRTRRRVGGQIGGTAAEVDMVDEHANDRLVLGRAPTSEGGQQDLLLDSEVRAPLPTPEREELPTRGASGPVRGAAQSLGDDETMMVIARELGECVAALHLCRG